MNPKQLEKVIEEVKKKREEKAKESLSMADFEKARLALEKAKITSKYVYIDEKGIHPFPDRP